MNFFSKLASEITPYTAGEQPSDRRYVKLNTNENPYPPSPKVREAIEKFDVSRLSLYPSPNADILRKEIAKVEGVEADNVFCGNGSDEVLALCFPAFFDPDGKGACFANITYSFYDVFARFFFVPRKIVPLKDDFSLNLDAFIKEDCQGYLIANPNAPTGIGIDLKRMEKFIASVPNKLVIADEAYMGFYGESCVPLTKKYENLLVVKTFSKYYSLAGIRSGYAIGNERLIDALFRVKDCFNSYPVDGLCQAICAAAVSDGEYYKNAASLVVSERKRVREELMKLGFFVPESDANFLFAANYEIGGKYIYERLKERGVLVRFWDTKELSPFLRITIGTREQNDILLRELKNIWGGRTELK